MARVVSTAHYQGDDFNYELRHRYCNNDGLTAGHESPLVGGSMSLMHRSAGDDVDVSTRPDQSRPSQVKFRAPFPKEPEDPERSHPTLGKLRNLRALFSGFLKDRSNWLREWV